MPPSLSRLRLSPHFGALQRFRALEGAERRKQGQLKLEVASASACTEVLHICRHLDLECEVLPLDLDQKGPQSVLVRFGNSGAPDCSDAEEEEAAADRAPVEIDGESDAGGGVHGRPGDAPTAGESLVAGPAPPAPALPKPLAERAERLLSAAPPGLPDFYQALLDHFPGYSVPIAKLFVEKMRAAGFRAPDSPRGPSPAPSSQEEEKKRKKKRKKKEKKSKKAKLRKKVKEDTDSSDDDSE